MCEWLARSHGQSGLAKICSGPSGCGNESLQSGPIQGPGQDGGGSRYVICGVCRLPPEMAREAEALRPVQMTYENNRCKIETSCPNRSPGPRTAHRLSQLDFCCQG